MNNLPLPAHYDPKKVGQVWEPNYEDLAVAAPLWAKKHGIRPALSDKLRIAFMPIDMQNTFCTKGFELYVGGRSGNGAVDDVRRATEFLYREMRVITTIVPTLDTHRSRQIFHQTWLVDAKGNHPAPYTDIPVDDVISTKWTVSPAMLGVVKGKSYSWLQSALIDYCGQLKKNGKFMLTIWPYHGIFMGIGWCLASPLHEAAFFHELARETDTAAQIKGMNPLTENYSVLRPEVLFVNKEPIAQKSTEFIKLLMAFDVLIIAGEAKSHCVAWTIDDLLSEIAAVDPSLAKKVYLLEDCTSPVVVPGVVDHTDAADAAFARFAKAGMNIVKSTDPIASWPGIKF
jgi:nicotinamidase-related amidase